MPEPLAALQNILISDETVNGMIAGRVFYDEVPDSQVSMMPQATLVLSLSGGPNAFEGSYLQLNNERVDIMAYSFTPAAARGLYRAVYNVLHNLRRTTVADCLIHKAEKDGGPITLRDMPATFPGQAPDSTEHWPVVHSSWMVLSSLQEVPV